MKDERYWPVLGTWLKDTVKAPPDRRQTARRVAERLPQTPQVQRHRWLPSPRRAPSPLAGTDPSTHQPSPIPAAIGHTPTVIGRTHAMFSPAKAIIAGALVFAIGGVMLVAQPFNQQSSASLPGAATDAAPQPPTEFTGVWCIGPAVGDRDSAWRNGVSMSDPRLQGDAYQTYETHSYEGGLSVIASTLSIMNEDGAWVSRRYRSSGALAEGTDTGDVFVGEGAYEGLIFFWPEDYAPVPRPEEIPAEFSDCGERHGVIIDGAVAEPYLPD